MKKKEYLVDILGYIFFAKRNIFDKRISYPMMTCW